MAWSTGGAIPIHDHRAQLILRDLAKYNKAQKAVKTTVQPTSKPAPKVQSPAPAVTAKDQRSEHLKRLDERLSRTGSRRDALALIKAGRK